MAKIIIFGIKFFVTKGIWINLKSIEDERGQKIVDIKLYVVLLALLRDFGLLRQPDVIKISTNFIIKAVNCITNVSNCITWDGFTHLSHPSYCSSLSLLTSTITSQHVRITFIAYQPSICRGRIIIHNKSFISHIIKYSKRPRLDLKTCFLL